MINSVEPTQHTLNITYPIDSKFAELHDTKHIASKYEVLSSQFQMNKYTSNKKLLQFVQDNIKLCNPSKVHLVRGTEEEKEFLIQNMVQIGMLTPLNNEKKSGCYLARSTPDDVARLEGRTFICSKSPKDAGPTNNWFNPTEMKKILREKFANCMTGRTMYIIPFSMGPIGSHISQLGVEITDSPYVAVSMMVMTRVSEQVLDLINQSRKEDCFVPCLHSVGSPVQQPEDLVDPWPRNLEKYICHFPEERYIASFGSGYGGNALLGKKCYALRIASSMAREEGWLAEHMLILGITNPQGEKKYIAAAFPSACGKTNLAMLNSCLPGWKIEIIGDDICWMRPGKDGRLYAINPENGFFGVAPGTNAKSNFNAMKSIEKDTIFTNVALTEDGDVWWEGLTKEAPANLIDWKGNKYDPKSGEPAAHPNSRFTAPITNCPILDSNFENTEGVPISAIIFGGRRSDTVPLIMEAFDWNAGVFMGASLRSEATKAALDVTAPIRSDPFAMLPFCGYNMAQYFAHWISFGKKYDVKQLPKIYMVNWFLKDEKGNFMWPGFSDNTRVMKWIFERCQGNTDNAVKTAIGVLPKELDFSNLEMDSSVTEKLFAVDQSKWKTELQSIRKYFEIFKDNLPEELLQHIERVEKAL